MDRQEDRKAQQSIQKEERKKKKSGEKHILQNIFQQSYKIFSHNLTKYFPTKTHEKKNNRKKKFFSPPCKDVGLQCVYKSVLQNTVRKKTKKREKKIQEIVTKKAV